MLKRDRGKDYNRRTLQTDGRCSHAEKACKTCEDMATTSALLCFAAIAVASETTSCSCEQQQQKIMSLQAQVAALRRDAVSLDDIQRLVRESVAKEQKQLPTREAATGREESASTDAGKAGSREHATARTAADSATSTPLKPTDVARRLSSVSPPTYVSVSSKHVHEFPNGHTCGAISGYMQYLPLRSDGSVSMAPSPADVAAEYSLSTIAQGWSATTLQAHPAPFKIVHDAACAAQPTLELPLNTSVPGSLAVGGVDVGTTLTALTATGTWQNVIINSGGGNSWAMRGEPMQYLVKNGVVYLKGGVGSSTDNNLNDGDVFAELPAEAIPSGPFPMTFIAAGYDGTYVLVRLLSAGRMQFKMSGIGSTNVYVDGISFNLS